MAKTSTFLFLFHLKRHLLIIIYLLIRCLLSQWARIVLVVERGVSPEERLKKLMDYSQPMSDGRRALVLRLNQSVKYIYICLFIRYFLYAINIAKIIYIVHVYVYVYT